MPTIAHLAVVEDSKEVVVRSKEEIVYRPIVIALADVKAEEAEQALQDTRVKRRCGWLLFARGSRVHQEPAFSEERDEIKFSWRYEDSWVLL